MPIASPLVSWRDYNLDVGEVRTNRSDRGVNSDVKAASSNSRATGGTNARECSSSGGGVDGDMFISCSRNCSGARESSDSTGGSGILDRALNANAYDMGNTLLQALPQQPHGGGERHTGEAWRGPNEPLSGRGGMHGTHDMRGNCDRRGHHGIYNQYYGDGRNSGMRGQYHGDGGNYGMNNHRHVLGIMTMFWSIRKGR